MVAAPTMLINIIVQMLNVIWSKLKIITSIIPLGNMFPLNLIPAIIEFTPKFFDLLWNGPKLIR